MNDQGVTIKADDTQIKHRRHSFLANLETPTTTKLYFRITNLGQNEVIPVVDFEYLTLEE